VDTFYRRHLPHWHPDNRDIFLTWRLRGSLPHYLTRAGHGPALQAGHQFVAFDRELDRAGNGPKWLAIPPVADEVAKVLIQGQTEWLLYRLHAWAIMPNHVHILISPLKPIPELTRVIKSASSRLANAMLNRRGQPLWQPESYDHWVRTETEFGNIANYIEDNPVRAGLASSPEEYRWSSATVR